MITTTMVVLILAIINLRLILFIIWTLSNRWNLFILHNNF